METIPQHFSEATVDEMHTHEFRANSFTGNPIVLASQEFIPAYVQTTLVVPDDPSDTIQRVREMEVAEPYKLRGHEQRLLTSFRPSREEVKQARDAMSERHGIGYFEISPTLQCIPTVLRAAVRASAGQVLRRAPGTTFAKDMSSYFFIQAIEEDGVPDWIVDYAREGVRNDPRVRACIEQQEKRRQERIQSIRGAKK